jgi:hypothetical protein
MNRKIMVAALLLLAANIAKAQITDPMITGWWFNTTGSTYKGILTDVEAVYYNTTTVYVKTSGVPDYYADGVSHNNAKDLKAIWPLPRVPAPAATPAGVMGGQMGLMYDGSVFFHPGDAQSYMSAGVWNRLAYYFEAVDMDASNGHSTPDNWYHHHFDNVKLHTFDVTKHSPIVAYAWDGYPVYGPFGYANTDGTGGIKRMVTSYSTKLYTTRTSGPAVDMTYPIGCFIEDWQYTAGSGDLDAHNGRFCKTPEYPAGTYAYFTTVDASLKPIYPYFIGPTYYGTFSMSNTGPTGGTGTVPTGVTLYNPAKLQADIAVIEANINIFPIPVVTDLNIQLREDKNYNVVIYDLRGAILQNKKITSSAKIDMSGLPYGVYFVEVTDVVNNSGFVKRMVKQ